MKLFRNITIGFFLVSTGIGALLHATPATAEVVCETNEGLCRWTIPSEWKQMRSLGGIRLTVGKDQNGQIRWVASPIARPDMVKTGTIGSEGNWFFYGTDDNDSMMEVPTGLTITHGGFQLSGGFFLPGTISLLTRNGNDIAIGGDHSLIARTGDKTLTPDERKYSLIAVLFPVSSYDYVIRPVTRSVEDDHQGAGYFIVGPSLTGTHVDSEVTLISGTWDSGLFCNLSSLAGVSIDVFDTGNKMQAGRFDDTDGVPFTGSAAVSCLTVYSMVMSYIDGLN